jgi:hypothetical protein
MSRATTTKRVPTREHHVGVIHRHACRIGRSERTGRIAELRAQLRQWLDVGARREAGESNPGDVIENHAARAFEIPPRKLVMRQVEQAPDAVGALRGQLRQ